MPRSTENIRQELQQRLQQRLNPQNVALGRVLEMNTPEFEDEVRRQLDDNPALEAIIPNENNNDFEESSEQLQLADYGDADDVPPYLSNASNNSSDDRHIEAASFAADDNRSMGEILMERLTSDGAINDNQRMPASYIIGNLDENGYLTRPLADIADDIAMSEGLYVDTDELAKIFEEIRELDPAGIGAVDLRDCLLLQLDRKAASKPVLDARRIVDNHFDLFSKKHFDRLAAAAQLSRQELEDALSVIQSLNPKPGLAIEGPSSSDRTQHVVPDFAVDYDSENDSFAISLTGHIPELTVEESFRADGEEKNLPRESSAATFIRTQRRSAQDFIKLAQQRTATLLAIGKAIVNLQRPFFVSGDRADILPMVLRDVAAITGLDLSVISRATSGKYVLTVHGIYPLKMFFNATPDADEQVSSHRILAAMQHIIDGEDKHAPLSDNDIELALAAQGIKIARRTVAKYRERLGLPVARLRRNF